MPSHAHRDVDLKSDHYRSRRHKLPPCQPHPSASTPTHVKAHPHRRMPRTMQRSPTNTTTTQTRAGMAAPRREDGWAAGTEQGVPILMTTAKVRIIFLISSPIPLTFATDLPGDTVIIASTLIRTQRPHEHLKSILIPTTTTTNTCSVRHVDPSLSATSSDRRHLPR